MVTDTRIAVTLTVQLLLLGRKIYVFSYPSCVEWHWQEGEENTGARRIQALYESETHCLFGSE